MGVLATDNFDRANNADLGANWDVLPSATACQVSSNNCLFPGDPAGESYNAVTWPNDQYSQVKITVFGGNGPGAACRMSTSFLTCYVAYGSGAAFNNRFELYKIVSGVFTLLGSGGTPATNDVVRCEAQGTTIRCLQNGVQRVSVTDTSIASGRAGVIGFDGGGTDPQADDWQGGDFATAAASWLFQPHPMMQMLVR